MGNRFASGKIAIAECDRCGQQYKLKQLKTEIIKQRKYQLLVCPECWDPDRLLKTGATGSAGSECRGAAGALLLLCR